MKLVRIKATLERTGDSRSALYEKIGKGLFPRPVKLGVRASAWPEAELDAILAARIAGASEHDLRSLVTSLHLERQSAYREIASGLRLRMSGHCGGQANEAQ
jgi:prophage regulatory protein